jgi:transposase
LTKSLAGRPSIAGERLLRVLLPQMLDTVRSERMLMKQPDRMDHSLLFRWFVGLSMSDPVWRPALFTKCRDRLLGGAIARVFYEQVWKQAREQNLLSPGHFTVHGTSIEDWAGQQSDSQPPPPEAAQRNAQIQDGPSARPYRKRPSTEAELVCWGM